MKILAIDTSTKNFSLVLGRDGRIISHENAFLDKILDKSIIPTIDRILKKAGWKIFDIDAFAVGLGPGSFTSLRVGLATVKGLAMATEKELIGISSLDVLAQGAIHEPCDEICVITDAKRQLLYACLYKCQGDRLKAKSKHQLISLKGILDQVHGRTLFVGDGVTLYKDEILKCYKDAKRRRKTSCVALFAEERLNLPDARQLFQLACGRVKENRYDDIQKLNPIYLYPEDCQVQK